MGACGGYLRNRLVELSADGGGAEFANGYDDSDATAATGMDVLDRKIDEGSYHHD